VTPPTTIDSGDPEAEPGPFSFQELLFPKDKFHLPLCKFQLRNMEQKFVAAKKI
jgi:hypothetical protein